MAAVRVPLLVGTSGGTPIQSTSQRVYNMYPVLNQSSKIGISWKNTPGWSKWVDTGDATIRGMQEYQGNLYYVRTNLLHKVTTSGVMSHVGTLNADTTGALSMASDGISLMITDDINIYRYEASALATISKPTATIVANNLANPSGIIFHDGSFVLFDKGTGRLWVSDPFRGDLWTNDQYATAEALPDNIVSLASDRLLWIFGEYSTQPYYNAGTLFPFKPQPQGLMIYGMVGQTHAQLDNTSYWLARSQYGNVKAIKANGFTPLAVSDLSLEDEWASFGNIDDAYANTMMWAGHEWFILTFPSEGRTFVYDTQGYWFEWGDYVADTGTIGQHPMLNFAYFNGQHLFSDESGNIHTLEKDTYNHNGSVMTSGFRSGAQHIDEQRIFFNNIILDMKTGVKDVAPIELRTSIDGGETWGNWETRQMGRVGKTTHRVQWHGLGSGYNMATECRITAEVPRQIISGVLNATVRTPYLERRNERTGIEQQN